MNSDDSFELNRVNYIHQQMLRINELGTERIKQIVSRAKGDTEDKLPLQLRQQLQAKVLNKRYRINEAAKLTNVSQYVISAAEADGRLPEPKYRADTTRKVRLGYTIDDINHIRKVFGTTPKRPDGNRGIILGILAQKGGSGKTTSCTLLAQFLATLGHSVVIVDTDPQGSATFTFGLIPDIHVRYRDTLIPYMLFDDGDPDIYGPENVLPPNGHTSLMNSVQKTYWGNIDIIASYGENIFIDADMKAVADELGLSAEQRVNHLRNGLLELTDKYDFVLLDGTPSLNLSSLNVMSACDVVYSPVPSSIYDFASAVTYAGTVAKAIETYREEDCLPNIPDFNFFINKYSDSDYAQQLGELIRNVFGEDSALMVEAELSDSDEIGKAGNSMYTVYELNPGDSNNRKKLASTTEMLDRLFQEIYDRLVRTYWSVEDTDDLSKKINDIDEDIDESVDEEY